MAMDSAQELGQINGNGIRLSTDDEARENNPPSLDRTFAVMLGELEDEATRLTQEHDRLLRLADAVAADLERVEAVRAAMVGKARPSRGRPARGSGATERRQTATQERVAKIADYARANGGSFTARAAADAVGTPYQGIGPVLAGMVRRGEATVAEPDGDGPRIYTLVA